VLAVQVRFTWVALAAVALKLPGVVGAVVSGGAGVVAEALAYDDSLPAASTALTW
jgi:hypothetical protein